MNQRRKRQESEKTDENEYVDIHIVLDQQGPGSSGYNLKITLTNISGEALKIYRHSLPWVGWHSILLTAVRTDALGTVIDKNQVIDDPGTETVTIEPGESLMGNILLVSRFPDLPDALGERDVIVFWSYRFQPLDRPQFQRLYGQVLLPKLS